MRDLTRRREQALNARAAKVQAGARAFVGTLARAAFERFWAMLVADPALDVADAIALVQAGFTGAFANQLDDAFSELLGRSVGTADVRAMPVGEITLSRNLYQHNRRVQGEVTALVRKHAQGVTQARELALRLYDGYNPQDGIRRPLEGSARAHLPQALRELTADRAARQALAQVVEHGQQQARRLRSRALRAAYEEAFDAWRDGAAQDALQRKLDVAMREKNRYYAERIAQTELARAHQAEVAAEFMADAQLEVVQVRMNPRHPLPDICDLHAQADLHGLGRGCYPKALAPRPPFHPHCWCRLSSRPDLYLDEARRVGDPSAQAREFLRSLPAHEAARVLGSRERLQQALDGQSISAVVNAGRERAHWTQLAGGGAWKMAGYVRARRQELEEFYFNKPGSPERIAIAALTDDDRALLGTSARELWLSRASLDAHRAKHPEVGLDAYARIPDILRAGEVWAGPQDRRFVLLWIDGKPYRAALKIDAAGKTAWFLSLIYNAKQKPPKGAVRIR